MKITIEAYGNKFVGELSEGSDIQEVTSAVKGLLVAAGYHPVTVDEIYDPHSTDSWNITPIPSEDNEHDTE